MSIPKQYSWLHEIGTLPRIVSEGLKLYGIHEIVGSRHNPLILAWGDEVGIGSIVNDDEQAWCALFMAVICKRAGKAVPMQGYDIVRALKWGQYGIAVNRPMLGDILILKRSGGGHVCVYIAEDDICYHVLGGNQSNQVSIIRIEKARVTAIRRPKYNVMPATVKPYRVAANGIISKNEA